MLNLVLALFLSGAVQIGQPAPKTQKTQPATGAPPVLDYSQEVALHKLEQEKMHLEKQMRELGGEWTGDAEVERAIAAEYAKQHPGWHLDPHTLQPTKDVTEPAQPAPALIQKK
jgi:hypothetical protein